jgi:hypothetical protein
MKKPTLKLAVRRETLRVLAGMELVRVTGGGAQVALLLDSADPVASCAMIAIAKA